MTQNKKRMPNLADLLAESEPRQMQTREEQLEALKMLSGMYGGKLITIDRRAV